MDHPAAYHGSAITGVIAIQPIPRTTAAAVLSWFSAELSTAATRVLIDTSPDLRIQLLMAGVGELDGVVFTHPHADHTHGIDELRAVALNTRRRVPVWADSRTADALIGRFGYAFRTPEGSPYPPILDIGLLKPLDPVSIGAGEGR